MKKLPFVKGIWKPLQYAAYFVVVVIVINFALSLMNAKSTVSVVGGILMLVGTFAMAWELTSYQIKCSMEEGNEKRKVDAASDSSSGPDGVSGVQDNSAGGSGNKD